jgi:ABC-type sulfate transport system permease component
MPLAVYTALQNDLSAAVALSVLLVILSFTILLGLRFAPWGAAVGGAPARPRGR